MQPNTSLARGPSRWTEAIFRGSRGAGARGGSLLLGVLPGEGIGPEVMAAALDVLSAVQSAGGATFEIRTGGAIGREAESLRGRALTDEVASFCASSAANWT